MLTRVIENAFGQSSRDAVPARRLAHIHAPETAAMAGLLAVLDVQAGNPDQPVTVLHAEDETLVQAVREPGQRTSPLFLERGRKRGGVPLETLQPDGTKRLRVGA